MAKKKESQIKTLVSASTSTSAGGRMDLAEDVPVEFSLHAPKAKKVSVAGTFNNWDVNALKLKKGKLDNWNASISLKPGRYEYRFFVDGEWLSDPKPKETAVNSFGTSNAVLRVA